MIALLVAIFLLQLAVLAGVALAVRRTSGAGDAQLTSRLDNLDQSLAQKFAVATADMASRLEQTKGDLRQEMADRVSQGFSDMRSVVDQQLAEGRREQSESLRLASSGLEQKFDQLSSRQVQSLSESRQELTNSLAATAAELRREFQGLSDRTSQSMEVIRGQVDDKLGLISNQVQQKLDENIREGFAHFTKVQEHLKAAEEQLRQVGALGNSINDLNSLLKLPHLRGRFGEASLERLLEDFLPAHMYELQASTGEENGRADAVIKFPDRVLPVDAKFPREQVLGLFETSNENALAEARIELVRVLKAQARRIASYIQPENGTMDVALMYLPSETLYLEAVRSADAMEALAKLKIFPVSPNTLLMMLQTVALAYKWYEVAARFEETRKELGKAQNYLGHFQKQFETLGSSLEKAQKAYETAARHLKKYRGRVTAISGEEIPELEGEGGLPLALSAAEGKH